MFSLYANKTKLTVRQREPTTSGSVLMYAVRFEFSPDWNGMERVAVFKAGMASRSILLDESNTCDVPWEVLTKPNIQLMAGVYGTRGGKEALPTIWAGLGTILEGVTVGREAKPPTPDLWEQELAQKGDKLGYTEDGKLGLYSGDKLLSAVQVQGGGGESGISDHRLLSHQDAEKQHPITAIDGLEEALKGIPTPMTAEQLRKILINGGQ